ncbi:MAG: S1 RNA-binding domain-containing protein, partial [Planctomycetota bacterium]|nr:S1 RNA-binding domain-containing protein [Planctomycetota bacterium]
MSTTTETAASLESVVASAVAERHKLDPKAVERALKALSSGAPAPYLARYRRAEVGGIDELTLRVLRDDAERAREMEHRREFILRAVAERDDVSEKLRRRIERCRHRTELEYLYEPYRPPRKTPGSLARERGLEALADSYLKNEPVDAAPFVDAEKGAASVEDALSGARDILAERFAVDPDVRSAMLRAIEKDGVVSAAPAPGKKAITGRHANLKSYEERLARVPSHRYLALRRAEKEGAVSTKVAFDDAKVLAMVAQRFYPNEPQESVKEFLDQAAGDAVRLMRPAVLEDALRSVKERADNEAIGVFSKNLCDLLLYPPAGPHRVMGVDPAPRGAIPVACVDERGEHLENARLKFFDKDETRVAAVRERLLTMVKTHSPQLIALGNGPGRRECERFLNECCAELGDAAPAIVVVNEAGVGSYASGPVGRSEQPALPVPVRGAVSIARRVMDPIAELVKVDPRQIGVGQYQSDVDANHLGRVLNGVVEHCVNLVGVDVNRASVQQLSHVAGLTTSVVRALVDHRERSGRFPTRDALKELPFITDQTFEHASGFLRVIGGDDPLDATGVHPSARALVEKIARHHNVDTAALVGNTELLADLDIDKFADETFGAAFVAGTVSELLDGGEDPRPSLEILRNTGGVRSSGDLKPGMQLNGRVTNVTNFGAFIDIGVQQDGLVHVSELADFFVKDPTSVVNVGKVVNVRVLGVDADTGKISLSMKSGRPAPRRREGGDRDSGDPKRGRAQGGG